MKRKHPNFIPKSLRPKPEVPHEIIPAVLVVFFLVYAAGWPLRLSLETKRNEIELKSLEGANRDLSEQLKSLSEKKKLAEQNHETATAIQKVLGRKNYWSEIFKEMSILIPDGVWLTHFSNQKGEGASVKVLDQLVVRGEAVSQMAIAKFLGILEGSHYFSGARMISSERAKNVKPAKFQFEFTIPVKAASGGGG